MGNECYFGTAGWSFADWTGWFYPKSVKRPLEYYADFFDCAEVNVTFYRPPDAKISAGWVRQVEGKRFVFAVKVSHEFTHPKTKFGRPGAETALPEKPWGRAEAREFLEGIRPIAEAGRLGPLLVQFPWSFRNTQKNRDRMRELGEVFEGKDVVVEVRHASWDKPEFREWLREAGISLANIDQPQLKDCLAPAEHVTGPVGYVRLHGRNDAAWFATGGEPHERYDYLYSMDELEPWAERVKRLMAEAKATYVIGNNHYRGKAPTNALQLMSRVRRKKVSVPEPLIEKYPQLKEIADKPKGMLF